MGASSSTCCGTAESPESQIVIPPVQDLEPIQKTPRPNASGDSAGGKLSRDATQAASVPASAESMAAYEQAVEGGLNVNLILQDKNKLKCLLKLDKSSSSIILSCGQKQRSIPLKDIKALLHTPEQLSRVENSAGISETDPCVAIHLSASGNCIPLFFLTEDDKTGFVTVVSEAIRKVTATSP